MQSHCFQVRSTLILVATGVLVCACIGTKDPTSETVQAVTSSFGAFPVTMAPADAVVQGKQVTYNVSALNDQATTQNLGVGMDFGLNDKINGVPAGCAKLGGNSGIINCAAVPVAPGASASYVVTMTPTVAGPENHGAFDFTVANGVTTSQNSVSEQVTVAPGSTDLQIIGSSNLGAPLVGQTFTYTFLVKNNGPFATSGGVSFSDTLPTTVTLSSVTTDTGTCSGDATVTCAVGDLAVGAQATIRINVAPNQAATIVNTATADLAAGQADANPNNNSVSVTVTSH